jgi:pimeloyl-ACP methyl ester carboxylesterase
MAMIYCIPGTGVDERLFSLVDFGAHPVKHVRWIVPHRKERLESYALRLSKQIDTTQPFVLVGVSFGGMLCASLMAHLHPQRVFLISSSKCRAELPPKIRFLKNFPFYRLLPDAAFIRMAALSRRIFGFRGKADASLFLDMLRSAPKGYFARAADCVVRWDAQAFAPGIIHIHGTHDRVLPLSIVKADYVIEGGSHNMMRTHAGEIGAIIRRELDSVNAEVLVTEQSISHQS